MMTDLERLTDHTYRWRADSSNELSGRGDDDRAFLNDIGRHARCFCLRGERCVEGRVCLAALSTESFDLVHGGLDEVGEGSELCDWSLSSRYCSHRRLAMCGGAWYLE